MSLSVYVSVFLTSSEADLCGSHPCNLTPLLPLLDRPPSLSGHLSASHLPEWQFLPCTEVLDVSDSFFVILSFRLLGEMMLSPLCQKKWRLLATTGGSFYQGIPF